MKQKTKKMLALVAVFAMMALAAPVMAGPGDRSLPSEDDPFWDFFEVMSRPDDTATCLAKVAELSADPNSGVDAHYSEFCTDIANMPSQMQNDMASEGASTNLFDASNWHSISGLYFQKTENGQLMGKISFNNTINFLTYRFFTFMNNFGNMVTFDNGYISLNAAMVPDMINYGTTFTMYGLDFPTTPDIYVTTAGGSTMRKANSSDLSGISYNAATGELSFTPGHFSAFKAVAKGSKVKKMKISSVKKKTIKYDANQSSFTITVKGTSLYSASGVTCVLGFNSANVVTSNVKGKKITCQFDMSNFSVKGWYPLTVTAAGVGEVRKDHGVKIK